MIGETDRVDAEAVIFDLDGTLLDTLADLAESVNEVLAQEGHAIHPHQAYRMYVGDGVEALIRRALPATEQGDPDVVAGLVTRVRAVYDRRWDRVTRPYDGILELLAWLRARGLPSAVLSNKPHPLTKKCVAKLLVPHSFNAVLGSMPGLPLKPDPTGGLRITTQLGVAPACTLYVGDTDTDMRTAQAAGFVGVGAAWGFRGRQELVDSGANVIVDTPHELAELIGARAAFASHQSDD